MAGPQHVFIFGRECDDKESVAEEVNQRLFYPLDLELEDEKDYGVDLTESAAAVDGFMSSHTQPSLGRSQAMV